MLVASHAKLWQIALQALNQRSSLLTKESIALRPEYVSSGMLTFEETLVYVCDVRTCECLHIVSVRAVCMYVCMYEQRERKRAGEREREREEGKEGK
jgi:hypothetical protein